MTPLILRREGHDPQNPPPDPEGPNPNDPIEGPQGAEPGPGAEPGWTPEREGEPVVSN